MRRGDAADKLVRLLSAAEQGAQDVVTTALLALRVLTDRCTRLKHATSDPFCPDPTALSCLQPLVS